MLHLTPSGLTSILMTTSLTERRPDRSVGRAPLSTEHVNLNRVHSTTVDDEGLSRGWLLCAARAVLDEATPAAPPHHLWDRLPHDAEAQHLAPLLDLALRREALGAPDSVVQ